jgi:trehalose synthase
MVLDPQPPASDPNVNQHPGGHAAVPRLLVERRKSPRSKEPPTTTPAPPRLEDYQSLIGKPELDELLYLAQALRGKAIKMVNSTSVGGGVAEMLNRVVPLLQELELTAHWDVIAGDDEFFQVTKAFHNALQGGAYVLTARAREIFLRYDEQNRSRMKFEEDVVVLHDPQPLALIQSKRPDHQRWIWRCHIDLSNPNRDVWDFLRPFVERHHAAIFSSQAFAQRLSIPQYLFYPFIDPLSEKNRQLDPAYLQRVCDQFGIDRSRPIVTQVSRFDPWKDPVGVIQAYRLAKRYVDCQLVLVGGSATDDPQGAAMLAQVKTAAGDDSDIFVLDLPPASALQINALQTVSTLVIQKSLREGFGLTVTEALWKGKPVIAGAVGGIPNQVIHKITGALVHSVEGCAYQIRYLLTHPEIAEQLGKNGREHVKENFLITAALKRWLLLCHILLGVSRQ